jgi:hypothetical protein
VHSSGIRLSRGLIPNSAKLDERPRAALIKADSSVAIKAALRGIPLSNPHDYTVKEKFLMKSKLALAVAFVLSIAAGASWAAGKASIPSGGSFASMDNDGNGHITMDEMKGDKKIMSKMKMLDKNSDDKISEAGFSAFSTAGNAPEK